MTTYPHLQLTDWPFNIVPSKNTATFLAARQEMQVEVDRLLRNMRIRPASSMHLLWAWYGAGKTHTLYYLAHFAQINGIAQSAIVELNRGSSMLEVCRAILSQIPLSVLEDAFLESFTGSKIGSTHESDYESALYMLITGDSNVRGICRRYLHAEPLTRQECREINVGTHIRTLSECVTAIRVLNRLLATGSNMRLLLVLDEFQKIADVTKGQRSELLSFLHSVFNACPENLTLILSFSGEPAPRMPGWLPRELADRIGLERVLLLPPLTSDQGMALLKETLAHYRPPSYSGTDCYPFSQEALEAVGKWVSSNAEMKPRTLIQAASIVLEDLEPLLASGALPLISADHVKKALHERKASVLLTAEPNG